MSSRFCPHCNQPMAVRTSAGVEVDVCDACDGLWLDAGEFDALVATRFAGQAAEARLDASARVPDTCRFCNLPQPGRQACERCHRPLGIACPADGRAMYVVLFEDFEFDRCPRCKGIWIDGHERRALSRRRDRTRAAAGDGGADERSALSPSADDGYGGDWQGGDWQGGDWQGGDWTGSGWGEERGDDAPPVQTPGSVASRTDSREIIERYAPREVACGECGEPTNRYASWKHEGQYFCERCVQAGRGITSQLARERASAPASFFEQPNLTVSCKACRAVVSRYAAWEFDGEYWCQRCADRDELRDRVHAARLLAEAKSELERERARVERRKDDPLFNRHAASAIYHRRLANDVYFIRSLFERWFS